MTETTTPHRARRKVSALLAAAMLASLMVIASPPAPAEAHTSGCSVTGSHQHGSWWYRSERDVLPTYGGVVKWYRSHNQSGTYNHIGTSRC